MQPTQYPPLPGSRPSRLRSQHLNPTGIGPALSLPPTEMARTEQRAQVVKPDSGTRDPARDEGATEVVDFTGERRGSSEAEQLIRNQ